MNIEGRKRVLNNELFGTFVFLACVSAENTGGSKFAEFVADHVFGYIHGDEFVAIMDSDGKAYEVRGNHRGAGPCLDGALLAGFLSGDHTLFQFIMYIRTFF